MNGVNNLLVRKRKGVLVAIAVVIVLAALMYALVVYTNVRREKAYDTMEKEISNVAEVIISIVPIVGITFAAIIVFFALLWRHKENKLKIGMFTGIKERNGANE